MKKSTIKTANTSHAWLGVITSLLLFVVCFTGSIAVFHEEIEQWEQVEQRYTQSQQPLRSLDELITIARKNSGMPTNFSFSIPNEYRNNLMKFRTKKSGKKQTLWINAVSGEILPDRRSKTARILTKIHTDLDLPTPYGRYIVGLSGVVLLYLILTAVIQHRRIFKEAFRFRFSQKKPRIMFSDLHKIIGTWGILFQTMIAFTGTVLGLVGLILLVMAFAAYKGDRQAAIDGFLGKIPEKTEIAAPMKSMQSLIAVAESYKEGTKVNAVIVKNYGDKNAQITAYTHSAKRLTTRQTINMNASTGNINFIGDFREMGIGAVIYSASSKLHFAEFGGTIMKFLYLLLGLSMSSMGVSGMLMWLERQNKSVGKFVFFSRLTIGAVSGLATATLLLFVTAMAYPESWINKAELQHKTYYISWLFMLILAYAFPTIKGYIRWTLYLLSGLAISAPLLNYITTGQSVFYGLWHQNYAVAGVDLTLFIIGLLMLFIGRYRLAKKAKD